MSAFAEVIVAENAVRELAVEGVVEDITYPSVHLSPPNSSVNLASSPRKKLTRQNLQPLIKMVQAL